MCVCEYEKIVELFQRDGGAYSGRGGFSAKEQGKPPRFGLFGTDGELWSEHRHFTVRAFKELGVGGKGMEEMVRSLDSFQSQSSALSNRYSKRSRA